MEYGRGKGVAGNGMRKRVGGMGRVRGMVESSAKGVRFPTSFFNKIKTTTSPLPSGRK